MRKIIRKKMLFLLLVVSFLIPLCSVPTVSAYGITIDSPELILPGDFSDTLLSIHESAYYKIYCAAGGTLTVNITFITAGDLWIYIYDSNKWQVATAWDMTTSQEVIYQPSQFDHYIIRIYRSGAPNDDPFNMSVTWTGAAEIPAFQFLFILFHFAFIMGIIVIFRKRTHQNSILTE